MMTNLAKARLGFLTAQLIGITLAGVAASYFFAPVRSRLWLLSAVLGLAGLAAAVAGRARSSGHREIDEEQSDPQWDGEHHPFAPVFNLSNTGIVMMIAALAIYVLVTAADLLPKPPPQAASAKAAPVEFPELELQGVAYSEAGSTAIIQGRTVSVGDYVEGVRVVAIGKEEVTLELAGEQRVLRWTDKALP